MYCMGQKKKNVMPKIIKYDSLCSMKIFSKFPNVNRSKLNLWLVICIAKDLIWTTLKAIFCLDFFVPLDCRYSNRCILTKSCPNKPYINGKFTFRLCIHLNMNVFVLLNTEEDILKNVGNRAVLGLHWLPYYCFSYYGSQWCPKTAWLQTFFKISSVVFSRTKKCLQVWNYLRVSKCTE